MSETEKPPHGGSQTMRASPQQGSAKPDKRGLKHTESSMPVLSKKTSKKKVIEPHVSEKPPSARKLKTSLTMSPSSPTKHSHDDSKSDKAQNELKPISPTMRGKVDRIKDKADIPEEAEESREYIAEPKKAPVPKRKKRQLRVIGDASRVPKMVLTIALPDGQQKKLFATANFLVRDLLNIVLDKLDLFQDDLFGLAKFDAGRETMLDPEKELGEEGVKETTELRLKFRYMKMPFKLVDPIFIHHYYTQLNNSIVRGDFFAPPKVAIKLAALQMHVVYGPFMRSKHKPGFLTREVLEKFVAPDLLKAVPLDYIQQRIFFYYRQQTSDITQNEAEKEYIKASRLIPAWGVTVFDGFVGDESMKLGVVEDGYMVAQSGKKPHDLTHIPFHESASQADGQVVKISWRDKTIEFKAESKKDARAIVRLVDAYVYILKKQKSPGYDDVPFPEKPLYPPNYMYYAPPVDRAAQLQDLKGSKKISLLALLKDIYVKLCADKNQKPLNRFMLQLETISEEGLVADSLDLRRCGLDDESLDTIASAIEELFQKRDELMKEKKKKVQADFKPTQLLVSFNRLTSGRAIAKLCQVCSFSSIDATQNQITSDSIRSLAGILKDSAALTELIMENNRLETTGAVFICDTLKNSQKLTTLNLANNGLGKESCSNIAEFARGCKSLTSLNISDNELGDKCKSLTSLNISDNELGDKGVALIVDALLGLAGSLQKLNLSTVLMGKRAMVKLSEFLRSNQTIEVLNIGGNKLGSSNASILVDFVKASPSLRELDVSFLGISSSATHPLVDALVHNQSITTLNLSGNSIDKKLASELSRMIKNNKTISKLALRSCGLDKAIMVEICASLCDNTTLREMDLAGNRMDSSEAIEQLEVALETNKTLSSLNIAACRIDANGIYTLCAGLKENTVIERLHLDGNPIGNAGLMRLIEGLQGAKKLTIVTLQETSIHTSALLEFLRALGKSSAVDTLDIRRNSDIKVNEELRKNLLAYNYIAFSL